LIALDAVLRRERLVVAAALVVLLILAWAYVWAGAGTGMSAVDMTALNLFPHLQPDMAGEMESTWPIVIGMWWVMMIAMMTPSAAPLALLYGLVLRRHSPPPKHVPGLSLLLLSGYLVVWLVFSVAAAAMQKALQPAGVLSGMMLWSKSAVLSATVLTAAGLYQLSPLKQACLAKCRDPVRYLTEHWRPGPLGTFVLGLRHGAYCVGCCWMLMAVLFVGGVMNLVWISVLTLLVLIEKLAPAGKTIGQFAGIVLVAWAAATLLV
jgi:predicted metal-binding membrane protein